MRDIGLYDPSTPLHVTAFMGYLSATYLLLREGAEINALTGDYQMTPLMLASRRGHVEVAQLLVRDFKANVNVRDREGETALHMAAFRAHLPVCRMLVEIGRAEVNLRDHRGQTPLAKVEESGWGRSRDREQVSAYLKESGALRCD